MNTKKVGTKKSQKKTDSKVAELVTIPKTQTKKKPIEYKSISSKYRHDKAEIKVDYEKALNAVHSEYKKKLTSLDKDLFVKIREIEDLVKSSTNSKKSKDKISSIDAEKMIEILYTMV